MQKTNPNPCLQFIWQFDINHGTTDLAKGRNL